MDSFTLTISHLQSPIFYLATVAAGSNLRPPFSIFDLTSGADGWALGSTICILHLLSPHFGPCCCSAICNPQSQSSIFSLEWGTGQEGSTGETWACPCERSARISSLNLLSLPQRSPVLAQRCPLLSREAPVCVRVWRCVGLGGYWTVFNDVEHCSTSLNTTYGRSSSPRAIQKTYHVSILYRIARRTRWCRRRVVDPTRSDVKSP